MPTSRINYRIISGLPEQVDRNDLQPNGHLFTDEQQEQIIETLAEWPDKIYSHDILAMLDINVKFRVAKSNGEYFAIYSGIGGDTAGKGKTLGSGTFGKALLLQKFGTTEFTHVLKVQKGVEKDKWRQEEVKAEHEAMIVMGLAHSKILLKMRGTNKLNNEKKVYMIMPYIKGKTLDEAITDENAYKNIHPVRILDLCSKLLLQVKQAHQSEWLHCDIKSNNVIWNAESNEITLIDFGLSQKMVAGSCTDMRRFDRRRMYPAAVQYVYDICLQKNTSTIEAGKIYIAEKSNIITYTLLGVDGKAVTGKISKNDFIKKFKKPLNLNKLNSHSENFINLAIEKGAISPDVDCTASIDIYSLGYLFQEILGFDHQYEHGGKYHHTISNDTLIRKIPSRAIVTPLAAMVNKMMDESLSVKPTIDQCLRDLDGVRERVARELPLLVGVITVKDYLELTANQKARLVYYHEIILVDKKTDTPAEVAHKIKAELASHGVIVRAACLIKPSLTDLRTFFSKKAKLEQVLIHAAHVTLSGNKELDSMPLYWGEESFVDVTVHALDHMLKVLQPGQGDIVIALTSASKEIAGLRNRQDASYYDQIKFIHNQIDIMKLASKGLTERDATAYHAKLEQLKNVLPTKERIDAMKRKYNEFDQQLAACTEYLLANLKKMPSNTVAHVLLKTLVRLRSEFEQLTKDAALPDNKDRFLATIEAQLNLLNLDFDLAIEKAKNTEGFLQTTEDKSWLREMAVVKASGVRNDNPLIP